MKIIVVEPKKAPRVTEIGGSLKDLQGIVGGYIEAIYPYEDMVAVVCNEEGKLENLPLNRALRDENGEIYDIIAGTFFITGLNEYNFASVPDNLIEKYCAMFAVPEYFI